MLQSALCAGAKIAVDGKARPVGHVQRVLQHANIHPDAAPALHRVTAFGASRGEDAAVEMDPGSYKKLEVAQTLDT